MSLKNKLNRMKSHISKGEESVKKKEITTKEEKEFLREIPYIERWKAENVHPYLLEEDYCLIREVSYPLSTKHGSYHFYDFLTAIDLWNDSTIQHPLSAAGHKANELFFFDTETTGLGGGTGNTIFLLGYASIAGDKLIVRQHILPHPGAEVPLYQSFLEKVNYKTLVTYNGKAFDWPQVKTRHTLIREHVPKLPAFGHFDLFHAARRLWKHKLERMKLSIVENEILGVNRVDDIPGYLAPMIYFDFVESKQPDGMIGILKHNELDILSLVTLYAHLTFQIFGTDESRTSSEAYEVGKWFSSLGEAVEAEKILADLAEGGDQASFQAKLTLGFHYKKEHEWEKARIFFEEAALSENEQLVFSALIELAKINEHRFKDLESALNYCEMALCLVRKIKIPSKNMDIGQLETRKNRLILKLAKAAENM